MSASKAGKILLYLAGGVVAVVVVWGFLLIGSPTFNRKLSADRNRIQDLRDLQSRIDLYFKQQLKLPQSLQDLNDTGYWGRIRLEDPTTKEPYGYKVVDKFSYQLCAGFELTSKDAELEQSRYGGDYGRYLDSKFWTYEAGHQCFKLNIPKGERKGRTQGLAR